MDLLARPARKQLLQRAKPDFENDGEYNIWYSKWGSDGSKYTKGRPLSEHRCVVLRDSGRTKATKHSPFCIHFAHGKCIKGQDCLFHHRIPIESDEFDNMYDVFGRGKFRLSREDMGGVGSFERPTRCIYVGNIDINDQMEPIVRNHFSEWGEIEHVTVVPLKGAAFVRYKHLANAEFAKEAMMNQSLEGNEVLNIRWATDDPHPQSAEILKRKAEDQVIESIVKKLPKIGELGTILDYQEASKQPLLENVNSKNTVDSNDYYFSDEYKKQYHDYMTYYENMRIQAENSNSHYATKEPVSLVAGYESSGDD